MLFKHFSKDPVMFAYHLGDLDDFYFPDCQFAATYGESPRIDDVVLVYRGLKIPAVLAFGLSSRFDDLLRDMLPLLPEEFFAHYLKGAEVLFEELYVERPLGRFLKMKLMEFNPVSSLECGKIVRLTNSDDKIVSELLDRSYPEGYYTSSMLRTGKYFGIVDNNRLIALAGVHVCSNEYEIAALGNVTTDPDFRGKGLATAVVSNLVSELVNEKKTVCLNVKDDNLAAISSYEKLGFTTVHEYQEGHFSLK